MSTRRARRALPLGVGIVLAVAACTSTGSERTKAPSSAVTPTSATTTTAPPPGACARDRGILIEGQATLDGQPLTAKFMGAVVLEGGLVTPCQSSIPEVDRGRYVIPVLAAGAATGCGREGTRVVLWTFVDDQMLHATTSIPWPESNLAEADVAFSTAQPLGAAPPTTVIQGSVRDRDGDLVPPGTVVEASIEGIRCAVVSTRTGVFDGYIMSIVGPESKPACRLGAPVRFLVDGRPTVDTGYRSGDEGDPLDLTVR